MLDFRSPRAGATAVVAAPLQMAMWFALVLVGFGVEFLWLAQGSHPNTTAVPMASRRFRFISS